MRNAILTSLLVSGLFAPAAQAGFFYEGLEPYAAESRCPDPHAKNKEGCPKPRTTLQDEKKDEKPDVRYQTREGLEKK